MLQKISTDKAPAAIGPYSQGIVLGNIFFASGQIPIDPATGEIHILRFCASLRTFWAILRSACTAALCMALSIFL